VIPGERRQWKEGGRDFDVLQRRCAPVWFLPLKALIIEVWGKDSTSHQQLLVKMSKGELRRFGKNGQQAETQPLEGSGISDSCEKKRDLSFSRSRCKTTVFRPRCLKLEFCLCYIRGNYLHIRAAINKMLWLKKIQYLWLSQKYNKPAPSFNIAWIKWWERLPARRLTHVQFEMFIKRYTYEHYDHVCPFEGGVRGNALWVCVWGWWRKPPHTPLGKKLFLRLLFRVLIVLNPLPDGRGTNRECSGCVISL